MPSPNDNLPTELKDQSWDLYEPKPKPKPKPKRFTRQVIEEAARKSITTRHHTLWGRAFDVHQKNSLDQAAKWLTDEVVRVLQELKLPVFDENFTQGMTEGQRPRQLTGFEIEDYCDEDD